MLLNLYLLSLLVFNEWCICYSYIYDENAGLYDGRLKKHPKLKYKSQQSKPKEQVQQPAYKASEGTDHLAEFNVANFVGQSEYSAVDGDDVPASSDKFSDDYEDDSALNKVLEGARDENYKKLSNTDYMGLYNAENEKLDRFEESLASDAERVPKQKIMNHKPQKKHMLKFPFFSRKRTVTAKPKKGKSRQMFVRCTKKTSLGSTTKNTEPVTPPGNIKINKRSYVERLCPLCKRIFTRKKTKKNNNNDNPSSNIFHNSRQYFQQQQIPIEMLKVNSNGSRSLDKEEENGFIDGNEELQETNDDRRKRETDNERRMKELEEVENKINKFHIPGDAQGTINNRRKRETDTERRIKELDEVENRIYNFDIVAPGEAQETNDDRRKRESDTERLSKKLGNR